MRAGLNMLMEQRHNLNIIAEAETPESALELAAQEQPDIVLLDLDLAGASSLDFLPDLIARAPEARVIIFTGMRDNELHRRAIMLGARGVVLKAQAAEVLLKAIEKVHDGEA